MGFPRTITLFYQPSDLTQRPDSLVVSVLFHVVMVALLSYWIMDAAPVKDPALTKRYSLRQLELNRAEPNQHRSSGQTDEFLQWRSGVQEPADSAVKILRSENSVQIPQLMRGPVTLVQPDVASHLPLAQKIPIPTVVIWTPMKTSAQVIVPPKPSMPVTADVSPSVLMPNKEVNIADLGISSDLNTQIQKTHSSTTSPLIVSGFDSTPLLSPTTAHSHADPSPVAVVSLSDLKMLEGTVTLPPVNQTAPATYPGTPVDQGIGKNGSAETDEFSRSLGAKVEAGRKLGAGFAKDERLFTSRVTLPKDGQFGVVIVGLSLADKYPEVAEIWAGTLAYTVYLHVGLTKSWILQYSLPRSMDAEAAGSMDRIEAPWPYSIVRPAILPGQINADALMIHGFVNQAGRFEGLAIAFPPEFEQAQFVLSALQQWQFRPAGQSGHPARVEVMLIIPEVQ